MEPITGFKFVVDEQYENEKGVFTVLSMHKDEMVIQWDSGEKIQTEIDLQQRIQQRRLREKFARETKGTEGNIQSRKSGTHNAGPEFEGLQRSDFKSTAARTTWRGRNQLGGAVTSQLPAGAFTFNSWAFAQKPEMHWADVEHRNRDDGAAQGVFFARLDNLSLSYGFFAPRPDAKTGSSRNWDSFATWLMQKENDRMLQALAIEREMAVYVLDRPAFGMLQPFEDGWLIADDKKRQKLDMLFKYIESLPPKDGFNLAVARKVAKDEALTRGKDIAVDIAQLFTLLMPLYEACAS
jgi:hypothetical protein